MRPTDTANNQQTSSSGPMQRPITAGLTTESSEQVEVVDLGDSPPTPPDADFWLETGRKWVTEGAASIRGAANGLITGLSLLKGIYLGIIGFARFIPDDAMLWLKLLYTVPLLVWMIALYYCLKVSKTQLARINLNAPGDIREEYAKMLEAKQHLLDTAFWFMFGGLALAVMLLILRLRL